MGKFAAKGAILAQATVAAPTVFTTVAGVKDFSLPLGAPELIDVTSHDSPGGAKEYVSGMIDYSEFTVPIVWDGANTQHAALVAAVGGVALPFKVTGKETTPKTYTFSALVRGIELSWPVGGAQEATLTLKPTGAYTIA